MSEDQIARELEEYRKLVEENNRKPVRVTRVEPPKVHARQRLAKFNREAKRKQERQKLHDTFFDVIMFLSFVAILYIAFGK